MEEERRTLRLSDAFETDTGAGEYEWTATMININSGKNQSIMDSCHVLYEYAVFVAKIKRYRDSMELKEAIDLAVRDMRQVTHALLTRPPLSHKIFISEENQIECFVRLACVKHAASVHPEPGSNSHVKKFCPARIKSGF